MADLKTNYVDDVLDASKNQLRKYQQIQNDDGTFSFVDVTEYSTTGTSFGAKDINDTNTAVNELNNSLEKFVLITITFNTSSGGNNFTLQLPDNIVSSNPLFVQFQSNTSVAYVKSYYVTEPGKVRVVLSESIQAGNWKFNVLYKK